MLRRRAVLALAWLTIAGALPAPAATAAAEPTKHRILVDKVLMADTDWRMTPGHVAEIAAAGFTALSPRRGNDDPAEVRRVAEMAARNDLQLLPWSRGTLLAPEVNPDAAAPGDRLVWADGRAQDLYAPDSDALWAWLTQRVVGYAEISVDEPALMGVFLDFENYAPGRQGNAYDLSYDAQILQRFADDRGLDLPGLAPAERRPWLDAQGLHDDFAAFQVDRWRQRCRALRQAVDAVNPAFRFCVYPAPGTPFIRAAVWPEWGTEAAPLMLADASTYGRPGGLLPHAEALSQNRQRLTARRAEAPERVVYLGGIDPIVPGADPEFSGRNAVQISEAVDGYWVFYEGPTYDGEHPDYFRWFTWANAAIESGSFADWRAPRATPEPGSVADVPRTSTQSLVGWYGLKPHMVEQLSELGAYEVQPLEFLGADYLSQFDVVVLQNLNLELPFEHEYVQNLRDYVAGGGGLLLAHDTAWFLASPVPEVARRAVPEHNVEAGRHVIETDLRVVRPVDVEPRVATGAAFTPEFRDHMVFSPGPRGEVRVRNGFDDAVYVSGTWGDGRVVFSGSYYGYSGPLAGTEADLLAACLAWLAAD